MNKFSKKIIITNIIKLIFILFWFLFIIDISIIEDIEGDFNKYKILLLIDGIVFVVGIVIAVIYSCLYYKTAGYMITNDEIKCQKGVIFKRTSIIKREKINAINTKQTLVDRIFGVKQILVDSGSTNTAFRAEFFVVLDNKDADLLYKKIKLLKDTKEDISDNNEDIENNDITTANMEYNYSFSSKGKFFYSLSNAIVIFVLLFILIIIALSALVVAKLTVKFDSFWSVILFIIAGWIMLSAFSSIVSVISVFFRYHNFKIKKGEKSLELSYGLFTKYDNSLEYSKIRGVSVYQNLLSRLFGYATIYINVIGYSDANNQDNKNSVATPGILIPLCKIEDVNTHINNLIGDYNVLEGEVKSPSVIPYLTWSSLIATLIMVIPTIILIFVSRVYEKAIYGFIIVGAIYFVYELMILLGGIMAKKTNSVSVLEDKISIHTGAFSKKIVVVFKKNIIAIEDVSTPLRRRKGIFSYIIHYHNNSTMNTIKVLNVSKESMDHLIKMIDINPLFIKTNIN